MSAFMQKLILSVAKSRVQNELCFNLFRIQANLTQNNLKQNKPLPESINQPAPHYQLYNICL